MKKISPSSSSKASKLDREQYLYLTTRGRKSGRDREIEIWFTERKGRFYVIAEYQTSHWLHNLSADSAVRVRVGERSFAARARVLGQADADLCDEVQNLSRQKYGWGDGTVVELDPD